MYLVLSVRRVLFDKSVFTCVSQERSIIEVAQELTRLQKLAATGVILCMGVHVRAWVRARVFVRVFSNTSMFVCARIEFNEQAIWIC